MENENENFDQLRRLLALKQHEVPPPGYFNKLPGEIISRLRAERQANANVHSKLNAEASWLVNFLQKLQTKPAFAVAFGSAVCALLLAGVLMAEKPETRPALAETGGSTAMGSVPVVVPDVAATTEGLNQPVLLAATNTSGVTPVNLFDLYKPDQALPASAPAIR